jgi:hypothetical protein
MIQGKYFLCNSKLASDGGLVGEKLRTKSWRSAQKVSDIPFGKSKIDDNQKQGGI